MANEAEKISNQENGKTKKKQSRPCIRMSIQGQYSTYSLNMSASENGLAPSTPAGISEANNPDKKIKLKQKQKKGKKIQHHDTLLTLLGFPQCVECSKPAASMLLLVLMSQVFHLLVERLYALPILMLNGASQTTYAVIGALLNAIQGPECWSGKNWLLNRPWIVRPRLSLGETKPSPFIMDYLGGSFKTKKKKRRDFYFPFIGSSMVLVPGLPTGLSKQIINLSPLSMPIVCAPWKSDVPRPVLELGPQSFDVYDMAGIKALKDSAKHCHVQIVDFLSWFCSKEKHFSRWFEDIERFRPVTHRGRFSQPHSDDWTEFLSAALSFFQQLLRFASEITGWITPEEAQEILLQYWRLVLPESAPHADNGKTDSECLSYKAPETFYHFLTAHFIPTYHDQIFHTEKAPKGAMGLIRNLDGTDFFITPRKYFLAAYARWLEEHQASAFDLSASKGEATIQRELLEAGVPLKGEKGNPATWRYSFYEKEHSTSCIALPIKQLPEPVQKVFGTLFGSPSNTQSIPNESEGDLDNRKEAKTL